MSLRIFGKRSVVALSAAALILSLSAGCSRGPSQKELSALEEQRQAVLSAEKKLADKKGEQNQLEQKVAEKKSKKQALEEKRSATKANLANMME